MAQQVKNQHSLPEDANLIPGLAQWVKDPVWLQIVATVADAARILSCCGCGVCWQL